jgi:spore maturation protein CgeB
MRVAYFTHSLASCWNHGNAHFQRGLLRELVARGHDVCAYAPAGGWSRQNLVAERGEQPIREFKARFPELRCLDYEDSIDLDAALQGCDLVIVHEWTDPEIAASIGRLRKRSGRFTLLFHDTHHRAISDPSAMQRIDLSGYDGVLAFGEALADVYRRGGWGRRAFVLHEAADVRLFKPPADETVRTGAVWMGNWGDGERTAEIGEYVLRPARAAGLCVHVYGVRYPQSALRSIDEHGGLYRGWIANTGVPAAFASYRMTVHVPRQPYARALPGIPTIRVFEALACGIPLLCAPWRDAESLFDPGRDYLVARSGEEMQAYMSALASDRDLCSALARNGLRRILSRHTCAHRADELLGILATMRTQPLEAV